MIADPQTCSPPRTLYRVGRASDPLRASTIKPEDAALSAGNRFDVPGGGVLYLASSPDACYGETLARYRTSPAMSRLLKDDDEPGFMQPRTVPQDWRLQRRFVDVAVDPGARFIDIDRAESMEWLRTQIQPFLTAIGKEDLDLADLKSKDRQVTRVIAAAVWNASNDEGELLFDGIRYQSRVDAKWSCWAVFDGTDVSISRQKAIELTDPDLQRIARLWDLRVF